MSLEDSMKDLADSNRELATALSTYAKVVEKYGLKLETDNSGKATVAEQEKGGKAEKPEKAEKPKTAAQKKADEKAAAAKKDDDDGFGDEEDKAPKRKKPLTHDDVKAKLLEIRDAADSKEPALELIGEFGYDSIPTIKEKDYEGIYAAAEKWLEENAG